MSDNTNVQDALRNLFGAAKTALKAVIEPATEAVAGGVAATPASPTTCTILHDQLRVTVPATGDVKGAVEANYEGLGGLVLDGSVVVKEVLATGSERVVGFNAPLVVGASYYCTIKKDVKGS